MQDKRIIILLALVAVGVRCLFNYVPSNIVVGFPLASLMQDNFGNWVRPELPLEYYVNYLSIYIAFACAWRALEMSNQWAKLHFLVLFWAELASLFDFMLRYGQDMYFAGFDMNTVKILVFAASFPVKFLLNFYGGNRNNP